jgi:hypothetical protein
VTGTIQRAPAPAVPGFLRRALRHRRTRWLAALVLVLMLVALTIMVFRHSLAAQQSNDPRSSTRFGAGALGALLTEEGVTIQTVADAGEALRQSDDRTTLVVANASRLSADEARRLSGSTRGRLIVLQPGPDVLRAFGLAAEPHSGEGGVELTPECSDPSARLAGSIRPLSLPFSYRPTGPAELRCYPTESGFAYLRTGGVDLVAGAITNAELGDAGNAAFAMNVFGSQPRIVWLMTPAAADPGQAGQRPTLLPPWWAMGLAQSLVALVVLGIWRGRRLGPILMEPLPVTVRASETVEGHGRLYYRLGARDRAAWALRNGARQRLARAFGHRGDVFALSAAVATRTGRDPGDVRAVLDGPPPGTDDQLTRLARDLDQLELEARRP